jgi:cell wall-associated NlpC family hydrolase
VPAEQTDGVRKNNGSPIPPPTPTTPPHHKKNSSPTAQPSENPETNPSVSPSLIQTPAQSPPATASANRGAPNASVSPDQIKGFENYPPKVQTLLAAALELTTRNLSYKYGSADPASGGMDCSGFIYFVLKQNGMADPPRDSSEQYNWLRKARTFEPVLSRRDDSYELNDLRPGDLLFWTGTYAVEKDPPITHTMIYVGREKKTGNRIMVGSSDGRVYHGESRNGVSVFDFKVGASKNHDSEKLHPLFVGYGHIPGLQE